jgi:hypothetical protein
MRVTPANAKIAAARRLMLVSSNTDSRGRIGAEYLIA